MIDLSNLINLLPAYFKHKDTYKDEYNKGILERFLNVCGEYFKEEIMYPIDNIINILDFDKPVSKQEEYLFINLVWEFLGSIPFGYGAIYNGNDTNNPWKENSELLPRAKYWDILKYAISLYKIRGTIPFYTILMSFYDIECKVFDPTDNTIPNEAYFKGSDDLYFTSKDGYKLKGKGYGEVLQDTRYDSDIRYDQVDYIYDSINKNCLVCNKVYIELNLSKLNNLYIDNRVKDRILMLLNRFRPINVIEFSRENVNFIY